MVLWEKRSMQKRWISLFICFTLMLGVAFFATAGMVEASVPTRSEAANALKEYILKDGDYDEDLGQYLDEKVDQLEGRICYVGDDKIVFIVIFPEIVNDMWLYFAYDISTQSIETGNAEAIIESIVTGDAEKARAPFSFKYHDRDRLHATIYQGGGVDFANSDMSDLMTTGIYSGMMIWNDMIRKASGNRYNIGNLGFTNYITPTRSTPAPLNPPKPSTADDSEYVAMYRMYNPNTGEHFYTSNATERKNLIDAKWRYEGIGWYAPVKSGTPVYRLYNQNAGDHHYTINEGERNILIRAGWKSEGVGWYSDDAEGTALYRQYNPNAKSGSHNYTTSKAENDQLVRAGWHAEGVGWYGLR